jgi:hypothetical protein
MISPVASRDDETTAAMYNQHTEKDLPAMLPPPDLLQMFHMASQPRADVADQPAATISDRSLSHLNRAGAAMNRGAKTGLMYCGRFLGRELLPGSNGYCGPNGGPQCVDCVAECFESVTIAIPHDCKMLGRILWELCALHLLQKFIDLDQNDSKMEKFHQSTPKELMHTYGMPGATAVRFIEKCRIASTPVVAADELSVSLAAGSTAADITVPDDCKVLGRILRDLGALHLLQEFVDQEQNDSKIDTLHKLNPKMLFKLCQMPEATAVQFIEKCRIASTPVVPDVPCFDANDSERALWLKAVLILEACTKGVKPFVAKVMQRLHSRVVENVKQDVARDLGMCDDEDWNCSTYGDADDVKFIENGPVTLAICTMDSNGVADCQTAHYLKPYTLKPCRLSNIPSGCFSFPDNISPASPVLISPNPPDIDQPDCSTFILTHAMHLPVGSYLAPFFVTRCQPSEPALQFHAVLCCSRPGHTAALVKSFRLQQALPEARGELSFAFWSLASRGSEFHEWKHGIKKGHVLLFAVGEGSALPPGIAQERRYLVTDATDFSFNICGPIISPVSPMTSQSFSADGAPLVVIRRSPIGR